MKYALINARDEIVSSATFATFEAAHASARGLGHDVRVMCLVLAEAEDVVRNEHGAESLLGWHDGDAVVLIDESGICGIGVDTYRQHFTGPRI